MQVALTVWQGRISPLFDANRMLLVADIQKNKIAAKHYEPLESNSAFLRASQLEDLGVKFLSAEASPTTLPSPSKHKAFRSFLLCQVR